MVEKRRFILGEEKYIDFQVRSIKPQKVIVTSANYKLSRRGEDDIIGECEIDGDIISVLLEPPQKGDYLLEVTYIVAPERLKIRLHVSVV